MLIREATPDDALAIALIQVRSWQAAYHDIIPSEYLQSLSAQQREAVWSDLLQADDSQTLVVEEYGEIRGWINVGKSRDADAAGTTAEVWGFYIAPGHWGNGLGRGLWADASLWLVRQGYTEVTLWVLRDNPRAIRFYRAAVFQIDHGREQTIQPGGATLIEIRLRRELDD